jgi:hypothetical protein
MASSFIDVCRFNPTAGGTTDWTYASAVTGYQGLSAAGAVNGATYSYRAESSDLTQWEVGTGVYNSGTGVLTRAAVLFNSSGTTSKINFSATPQVAVVALAEDLLLFNAAMSLTSAQQRQARENIGSTVGVPDVIIEDQKAANTAGGTSSSGSNTRTLNTLVRNVGTLASLSSNKFTLPAGSYYIAWSAPCWRGDQNQTLLRNVTDSSNVAIGTSEYSASATDNAQSRSSGSTEVTIASSKEFSIFHSILTGRATNGLGLAANQGVTEVYCRVEITRLT